MVSGELKGECMSESQNPTGLDVGLTLRDRIAAAIINGCPDHITAGAARAAAGAVIAELGLREEHRERSHGNWPNQPQVIYRKQRRYISEWENDD